MASLDYARRVRRAGELLHFGLRHARRLGGVEEELDRCRCRPNPTLGAGSNRPACCGAAFFSMFVTSVRARRRLALGVAVVAMVASLCVLFLSPAGPRGRRGAVKARFRASARVRARRRGGLVARAVGAARGSSLASAAAKLPAVKRVYLGGYAHRFTRWASSERGAQRWKAVRAPGETGGRRLVPYVPTSR